MFSSSLIPSIEMRLNSLIEINRRKATEKAMKESQKNVRPTITISREFGCEAYPVSERIKELMETKTGESWLVMDKALLEEVAHHHSVSENLLEQMGEKARFLEEIIGTFAPHWKTEKDLYRLICRHILALASAGNVIIVGRGGAYVTQALENCHHFRMYASQEFKVRSISRRLEISREEAEKLIEQKQKQRDKLIRDFLNRDAADLSVYDLVFNNDRNSTEKIAQTMMEYVTHN